MMRLNRYLAAAGLGSRRAVEQLILAGTVSVNDKIVQDLATQVDPEHDAVVVGGQPVHPARRLAYLMLNKPRGYDVTRGGEHHHRRAWDLLPKDTHPSVQSVGRLDRDSTGLLLFTNDGDLAFRLAHPRYGCHKTYEVEVEGSVDPELLDIMKEGIQLEDGPAQALAAVKLPTADPGQSRLRIVIAEGRNRIVRRMCERVGHPVVNLSRTAIGDLQLGSLPRGKTRPLTVREVNMLRRSVSLEPVTEQELASGGKTRQTPPAAPYRTERGGGSKPRPSGRPPRQEGPHGRQGHGTRFAKDKPEPEIMPIRKRQSGPCQGAPRPPRPSGRKGPGGPQGPRTR